MVKRVPIVVRGRQFPTLKAAADAYGLTTNDVSRRLRWGWTPEQAVGLAPHTKTPTRSKPIIWNGTRYASIRDLAEATGVQEGTLAKRLRSGKSVEEAAAAKISRAPKKGKRIEFNGEQFNSWKALASRYGINDVVFSKRVKRGWTVAEALELDPAPRRFRTDGYNASSALYRGAQTDGDDTRATTSPDSYKLYVVRNKANGKEYVGITVTSLRTRFRGHVASANKGVDGKLYNAIRKYGPQSFEITLIRSDAGNFRELQLQEVHEIIRRNTLRAGYNAAQGGSIGTAKQLTIGSEHFASWGEAAHRYGIEPTVFAIRISRLKWTPEQAAEMQPRPKYARRRVVVNGQGFRSLQSAAEHFGRDYKKVHDRHVQKGWSLEQALDLAPAPPTVRSRGIAVRALGRSFRSLSECARYFAINPGTLQVIVKSGRFSVEDAVRHLQTHPKPGAKRNQRQGDAGA